MSNILKKINEEIEIMCSRKNIMLDEEWSISLHLTEEEREEFVNLDFDPTLYWEFDDENKLTICHSAE